MVDVVADALVRIRPQFDESSLSTGARSAGEKAGKESGTAFSNSFKTLLAGATGAIAAIAGAKVTEFFKDTINNASDLSESTSKLRVVFGKASQSVLDFGKQSATSMGLSQNSYRDAVGTLGNLFVALKLPGPEAAKMSTKMVQLAGDLASFNNTKPEDALEALRSGLVGETEPLRQYGVNITAATLQTEALKLGLIKHIKDGLTPAQKATATYALVLDQTKTAQGDFKRTQDGLANSTRIAAAQWDDLKTKLGEIFLPIAQKVFKWLKNEALPALSSFIEGLKGVNSNADGLAGKMNVAGAAIKGFFDGIAGRKSDVDGVVGTLNSLGGSLRDAAGWLSKNKDLVATSLISYASYKVAVDGITAATKLWRDAQLLLDGALLANPIGLIVAAVVGYIAIWVTAYNRVKWFHDAVTWWFGHLLEVAKAWVQGWKDVLSDAQNNIEDFWNWFAGHPGEEAHFPLDSFWKWFLDGWSSTFTSARNEIVEFWNGATGLWNGGTTGIGLITSSFWTGLTGTWNGGTTGIRNITSSFWTGLTGLWNGGTTGTLNITSSFWSGATGLWNSGTTGIRNITSSFWSGLTGQWNSGMTGIQTITSSALNAIGSTFSAAWSAIRSTLSAFFTWFTSGWRSTLAEASATVASGVDAIGRYWDALREKVRTPINIVIGFINRGIVDPVNSLISVFGGTHVGQIAGLHRGGVIPGSVRNDGILGLSGGGVPTARVESGEFVVNRNQTRKHFGLLQALNAGVEGFALGGLIGGIGNVIGLVTDPIGTLSSGLDSMKANLGSTQFAQMLAGIPKYIIDSAAKWIKDKFSSLLGGGGAPSLGGPGGDSIAAILTWARVFDPTASVSSGYRPGAADYHGAGLAADIVGANMDAIAQGFYGMSSHLLELIHSPSWFVKNGIRVGPDFYASVFAEHFNHVHVAAYANALGFANGGVINEKIWGVGASGRRYTFGENGPETVIPGIAGNGGGFQFNVHIHGDVSDAHIQEIKRNVNEAFNKFYVQLKTGRRK